MHEMRGSTWDCAYTTGGQVSSHPLPVSIAIFLERKHRFVGVAEGEVEGLRWEVADDVGRVASPEGSEAFAVESTAEAVADTLVPLVETAGLDHFILLEC